MMTMVMMVCVCPFFLLFLQQYELHEEKVDPAHARRHHMEAQAAEAAALGLGGYALYEHHQHDLLNNKIFNDCYCNF
jgi:hypothetical protein